MPATRLRSLILHLNDQQPVSFQLQIPIVITEIIGISLFIGVLMGMVTEAEAQLPQLFLQAFAHTFALWYLHQQQAAVLPQNIVDIPDIVVLIAVLAIVVGIPAIIITILLIQPSPERLATGQATTF